MSVADDIFAARRCGVVRCGLATRTAVTAEEVAQEFGLRDEASCYRQIDEKSARELVRGLLHRDMAYATGIMP